MDPDEKVGWTQLTVNLTPDRKTDLMDLEEMTGASKNDVVDQALATLAHMKRSEKLGWVPAMVPAVHVEPFTAKSGG